MTRTLLEKCEIPISSEEKTLLQLAASMAGLSLSGPCENLPAGNRRDPVG